MKFLCNATLLCLSASPHKFVLEEAVLVAEELSAINLNPSSCSITPCRALAKFLIKSDCRSALVIKPQDYAYFEPGPNMMVHIAKARLDPFTNYHKARDPITIYYKCRGEDVVFRNISPESPSEISFYEEQLVFSSKTKFHHTWIHGRIQLIGYEFEDTDSSGSHPDDNCEETATILTADDVMGKGKRICAVEAKTDAEVDSISAISEYKSMFFQDSSPYRQLEDFENKPWLADSEGKPNVSSEKKEDSSDGSDYGDQADVSKKRPAESTPEKKGKNEKKAKKAAAVDKKEKVFTPEKTVGDN